MKINSPILCALCFILMQIIDLNAAESEFSASNNTTDHTSSWKSDREKRSPSSRLPRQLRITIRYDTTQHIYLVLYRQMGILANEYLPVVIHRSGLDLNVMKDIGEFVMYHDMTNCAAVVYFEKFNGIYGVIGMDHYVHGIPFAFDESGEYQLGVVGEPYVGRNGHAFSHIHPDAVFPPPFDTEAWEDFIRTTNNIPHSNIRSSTCETSPSTTHRQEHGTNTDSNVVEFPRLSMNDVYYLESLVFVTRDLTALFKAHFGENYIAAIVRYHIIYFNAVDVIVQKLGSGLTRLYINIAKIVIEDDLGRFDFMSDDELQFTDVVNRLPQYLYTYQNEYPPDSFDHVFIHTSRAIMDDSIQVTGLTKHGQDMYEARKNRRPYEAVPVSLLKFQYHYAHYAVAVHEIARVVDIKITSRTYGLQPTGQCSDIMQREGPKCNDCLQWNKDNYNQMATFLRTNRNRCFFLNEPRSIRPQGVSRFVTANRQCHCYGYASYQLYTNGIPKKTVSTSGCSIPLKCRGTDRGLSYLEPTVTPFDGTECSDRKVCWQGACVALPVDSFMFELHQKPGSRIIKPSTHQ